MNCSTNLCNWTSLSQRTFGTNFQINIKKQKCLSKCKVHLKKIFFFIGYYHLTTFLLFYCFFNFIHWTQSSFQLNFLFYTILFSQFYTFTINITVSKDAKLHSLHKIPLISNAHLKLEKLWTIKAPIFLRIFEQHIVFIDKSHLQQKLWKLKQWHLAYKCKVWWRISWNHLKKETWLITWAYYSKIN